jgi:hypothetical protein
MRRHASSPVFPRVYEAVMGLFEQTRLARWRRSTVCPRDWPGAGGWCGYGARLRPCSETGGVAASPGARADAQPVGGSYPGLAHADLDANRPRVPARSRRGGDRHACGLRARIGCLTRGRVRRRDRGTSTPSSRVSHPSGPIMPTSEPAPRSVPARRLRTPPQSARPAPSP